MTTSSQLLRDAVADALAYAWQLGRGGSAAINPAGPHSEQKHMIQPISAVQRLLNQVPINNIIAQIFQGFRKPKSLEQGVRAVRLEEFSSMQRDEMKRAGQPAPPGGWPASSTSPSSPQGLETRSRKRARTDSASSPSADSNCTLGAVTGSMPRGTSVASPPTATKGTPPARTGPGSKALTGHRPQANLPIRRTSVPRSTNTSKQVGV